MKVGCALSFISSALLMLFGSIDLSFGAVEPIEYESASILAPCLLELSEKYFKSERAMRGSLVIINLVPNPKSFLQRRILESVNEDKKHALGIMVKDARLEHKNASRVTDRAKNYLLLMLNLGDLTDALKQWKMLPTWNPLAQTVIVFMNPIESVDEKIRVVRYVFEELFKHGILFANVLYQLKEDPYKLEAETWFPYYGDACAADVSNIYKIDECIVTVSSDNTTGEQKKTRKFFEFNSELYPKVPKTLHNCPMLVSTFIWEPFVVGNDSVESGLEVLMLRTITQQMKLDLTFNILDDGVASAKISDDNQTGIYADLIQK